MENKDIDIKNRTCYYFDDIINGIILILVIFYQTKNYIKILQLMTFHTKFQRVQTIAYYTVSPYHVTYSFQIQSTPYSCLNVKELLAQNRREI